MMTADLELACISDSLSKLTASPERFSFFYNRLVGLKFPLAVADILELRYVFNQAIDHAPEPEQTRDFQHFRDEREAEMEALGVDKRTHVDRLTKLLAMLRQIHLAHTIDSRDTEAYLRKALANNDKATRQSRRYGKTALAGMLCTGALWLALGNPGWFIQIATVALAYLAGDYFYSLSILKREKALLWTRLDEVLGRRVNALNWPVLIKNLALILGYAKITGVEAFLLETEHEDAVHSYL